MEQRSVSGITGKSLLGFEQRTGVNTSHFRKSTQMAEMIDRLGGHWNLRGVLYVPGPGLLSGHLESHYAQASVPHE